ncbi:hypothetical protein HYH03_005168 [Edaphochlamys debaryana]|uniref:Uncharacterized protein n=1 Tax=Edaphochlamys debaryana TaxID=47281 RepID=A0A835YFQ6_9CHLO|nr:hypothetical protein HYH03_005168 [Edaphochlamys debaryana]|eukprot:KAG2496759.1 hypothetical protein HYH03_005168 [Edaphochlamys debaryana]
MARKKKAGSGAGKNKKKRPAAGSASADATDGASPGQTSGQGSRRGHGGGHHRGGMVPNLYWGAVSMDQLRSTAYPRFVGLPDPSELLPLPGLWAARFVRQDSTCWSALHAGVLTTGLLKEALGLKEPGAARVVGGRNEASHAPLLAAYRHLRSPHALPPPASSAAAAACRRAAAAGLARMLHPSPSAPPQTSAAVHGKAKRGAAGPHADTGDAPHAAAAAAADGSEAQELGGGEGSKHPAVAAAAAAVAAAVTAAAAAEAASTEGATGAAAAEAQAASELMAVATAAVERWPRNHEERYRRCAAALGTEGLTGVRCAWGRTQEGAALAALMEVFPASSVHEIGLCSVDSTLVGAWPGLPPLAASPDGLIAHHLMLTGPEAARVRAAAEALATEGWRLEPPGARAPPPPQGGGGEGQVGGPSPSATSSGDGDAGTQGAGGAASAPPGAAAAQRLQSLVRGLVGSVHLGRGGQEEEEEEEEAEGEEEGDGAADGEAGEDADSDGGDLAEDAASEGESGPEEEGGEGPGEEAGREASVHPSPSPSTSTTTATGTRTGTEAAAGLEALSAAGLPDPLGALSLLQRLLGSPVGPSAGAPAMTAAVGTSAARGRKTGSSVPPGAAAGEAAGGGVAACRAAAPPAPRCASGAVLAAVLESRLPLVLLCGRCSGGGSGSGSGGGGSGRNGGGSDGGTTGECAAPEGEAEAGQDCAGPGPGSTGVLCSCGAAALWRRAPSPARRRSGGGGSWGGGEGGGGGTDGRGAGAEGKGAGGAGAPEPIHAVLREVVEVKSSCPFGVRQVRRGGKGRVHSELVLCDLGPRGALPALWVPQLQLHMLAAGTASGLAVSRSATKGAAVWRLWRDDAYLGAMMGLLESFVQDYVLRGLPPPPDMFSRRPEFAAFLGATARLARRASPVVPPGSGGGRVWRPPGTRVLDRDLAFIRRQPADSGEGEEEEEGEDREDGAAGESGEDRG